MNELSLNPDQIIGMIDYPPLHSPKALRDYFEQVKEGLTVNPIPVIPKTLVLAYMKQHKSRFKTYEEKLNTFLRAHPRAAFFMIDGKHRAVAATLAGKNIPCFVLNSDEDVKILNSLKDAGMRVTGLEKTLKETIAILETHFFEHKRFWTVEEKTEAMIANGDIPSHMQ